MPAIEVAYNQLNDSLKQMPQGIKISEKIHNAHRIQVGTEAKNFTLKDTKSQNVSLYSFKGKYVLLDFWASWCLPCREETPNILAAYQKYKDNGFSVISISIDTDRNAWLQAVTKDKAPWAQVSDLKGPDGEVYKTYGISTIPATFLIDRNGVVVARDLKGYLLQDELAKIFTDKE
ncbi:MAG: TlpA disulfide reductase family protein [Chitinophagaceae bacterium]